MKKNIFYTIVVYIQYKSSIGSNFVTRTTSIPAFPCEFEKVDDEDEDCNWESTLMTLLFFNLKNIELMNFLKGSHPTKEDGIKLRKLNETRNIIELYQTRFELIQLSYTVIEQTYDESRDERLTSEVLIEEYFDHFKNS